ncbi:MAG: ATP synthase F1 subunit delta [Caulobacterales bacterium 68-7]|nr:F0F1 ATP synthase subunit delta [Caulobacterales bacterium]OJU09103.1 MAG: ATP synthase F1 subunit delta [Caulobacterales bacterium 68-7]
MADDIKATDAGQRYAKALFDLADDSGAIPAVEADLKSLKAMLSESKDLARLMSSPAFSSEDRAKGLTAVAERAKLSPLTRKFLGLLAANGRAALLQSAIAGFLALSAKRRGVVAAEVTTAIALTPAQQKGVAAALRTALGKDPELSTRVDPAILGGMKVRVGSRLFDASLKSRLDSLKFALKRA